MIKGYFVTALLLSAFVLLFSFAAFGWDDTGHKVSAYIAWQQMAPEVRSKVIKLLRAAPEDSSIGVYYLAGSRSAAAKELDLFMIASTWPDIVRDREFKVRFEKYNQGPWHIGNFLWRQVAGNAELLPQRSDGKGIVKLYEIEKELGDTSISDAAKAVNIAWFLHIAGDIHNPLHNASRITDVEIEGDRGGNLFLLSPVGTTENRLNLHSYWDGILRRNIERKNDEADSVYIPKIANKVTKRYPFAKMKQRLKLSDYNVWQQEGYDFLNTSVYTGDLRRNELPGKAYQKRAFVVGQEQIALAGYRIAETLNSIFRNK